MISFAYVFLLLFLMCGKFWGCVCMDAYFSRASPFEWQDLLLFKVKKTVFYKKLKWPLIFTFLKVK